MVLNMWNDGITQECAASYSHNCVFLSGGSCAGAYLITHTTLLLTKMCPEAQPLPTGQFPPSQASSALLVIAWLWSSEA